MTLLVKQWIKSTANANLIGVNLIFRFVLPSTRSSVITVNFFTVSPLSKDRYLLNNYLNVYQIFSIQLAHRGGNIWTLTLLVVMLLRIFLEGKL